MQHFAIVLALVRSAVRAPDAAVENHARRLVDALHKDGETLQADQLRKVLDGSARTEQIQPSRVVLSRSALPGEQLTPSVKPPVDKETGSALADISAPGEILDVAVPVLEDALKESVRTLMQEWKHVEELRALGVRPPLSCLLYGAPGTGKTKLAHVMSREMGLPLVTARLDGLISSFLGTTARNISALFAFANRYRCILLLDEFDAIAKVRDDPHEVGEIKRVVNTLLQCLDQRSNVGVTVAITNHEQLLDSAIWRRFDTRISVPKPQFRARSEIVGRYVAPLPLTEVEVRFLAWLTEGLTGSEIETVANALKRASAMAGEQGFSLIAALRVHAMLSANHQQHDRWEALLGPPETLVKTLDADVDLGLKQEELAGLLKRDQSTISRWKRKTREVKCAK